MKWVWSATLLQRAQGQWPLLLLIGRALLILYHYQFNGAMTTGERWGKLYHIQLRHQGAGKKQRQKVFAV